MKIGEEFYLDLRKERVYGIESPRNSLVVAVMCEGIKLGHSFPIVQVESCDDGSYVLQGGHHRALAHYLERVSMKCIVECRLKKEDYSDFILLDDIVLQDTLDRFGKIRLKDSLSCLPRDVAEKFCNGNGLDVDEYLSQ